MREWNNVIEGFQYSQIDKKRFAVEEAYLFAIANNGKKLTAYERKLDLAESKIGKSETEIKKSKEVKIAEYKKVKADMMVYFQEVRKQAAEEKLKKEEKDE
ncbi:hypothetical protein ETI10_01755 [Macrococcoides goetzii]|nr:hypothetical protein [Macrococcus goetzii]TDM41836.1 hypothetical protein ETI10_01755 [Macrococcus goetzii]